MSEKPRRAIHRDLVYDVGMHKGQDTDYYLKKGFRVVAFEADPHLAAHCRSRFAEELKRGQLTVVEGAITEAPPGDGNGKTIRFYRNKDNSVWGTVAADWARRNEALGASSEIIEVPWVDFSRCLEEYGIPHYLKIDIEGMDAACLRALANCEQKPDYVSIEAEKMSFGNLKADLNLLMQLGYTTFKAVQQSGISRQQEPSPCKEGAYAGYQFEDGSSGLFGADLPGKWKGLRRLLREYRFVFLQYGLFGDQGILRKSPAGQVLRRALASLLRHPVPGWYDTHAKYFSVGV